MILTHMQQVKDIFALIGNYIDKIAETAGSLDLSAYNAEALIAVSIILWAAGFILSIYANKDLYVAKVAPIYARFGWLLGKIVFFAYSAASLLLWVSAVAIVRLGKIVETGLLPLIVCAVAVCFGSSKAASCIGRIIVKRKYPLEYRFFQFKLEKRLR